MRVEKYFCCNELCVVEKYSCILLMSYGTSREVDIQLAF